MKKLLVALALAGSLSNFAAAAPDYKKFWSPNEINIMLREMGARDKNVRLKAWNGQNGALSNDAQYGQAAGGVVVMGNKLSIHAAGLVANYNGAFWSNGAARRSELFPYIDQWGVIAELEGNTAKDPRVQMRYMVTYVLPKGSDTWVKVQTPSSIGWIDYFHGDMGTSMTSTEDWGYRKKGLTGRWANQTPYNRSANGITTIGTTTLVAPYPVSHYAVGNYYDLRRIGVNNIDGVMVSVQMRLDPATAKGAKLAAQVGADFKPSTNGNSADRMSWYPGFGLSRFEPITTEWKQFSAVNVSSAKGRDGNASTVISPQRILNSKIPR